jgi:hypothetical protein
MYRMTMYVSPGLVTRLLLIAVLAPLIAWTAGEASSGGVAPNSIALFRTARRAY